MRALVSSLIVLAALALLTSNVSRSVFALAGIAVQLLGLLLAVRSHAVLEGRL